MIARLVISENFQPGDIPINHPDVLYFRKGEKLGIAEARKIKQHFSLKPYSAKGKTVVIEDASVMTDEAQNALLKTFEELPKEAMIILGASSDANLLPTILSRCQIIRIQNSKFKIQNYKEDIENLLSASIEDRFKYVEKLKDKEEFLQSLVAYFHQKISDYPKFTTELLQGEQWAKQNVNIRAILEYLMLSMPK
jgi:DNA polymerase III gamma/tau subunit